MREGAYGSAQSAGWGSCFFHRNLWHLCLFSSGVAGQRRPGLRAERATECERRELQQLSFDSVTTVAFMSRPLGTLLCLGHLGMWHCTSLWSVSAVGRKARRHRMAYNDVCKCLITWIRVWALDLRDCHQGLTRSAIVSYSVFAAGCITHPPLGGTAIVASRSITHPVVRWMCTSR